MTARLSLSGPPGSGKTTIARKAVELLKSRGCRVSGFYTPEVRVSGRRIGFKVERIDDGSVWLSRKGAASSYSIGSYGVMREAEEFIVETLRGLPESGFVVIDEIGPMELVFPSVRRALRDVLPRLSKYLIVVHRNLKRIDPTIYGIITRESKLYWVTRDNRDSVWREIEAVLGSIEC